MKMTCRRCKAMALTIEATDGAEDFLRNQICILGFRQLRGANWEARPLEDCPKPMSWVRLSACAQARGIQLPLNRARG